ncbi:hypothetical protein [Emticicia oligotrophica]|uniref:hypothetical protein n=1 Tax=Emticicia oligotrophica TaxID=312279 RepID=UPI00273AE441|nr:hypothetical protein [Emticicia oligotrophica]
MKIFLPILWFVLNVLSFNTLRSPYQQGKLGFEDTKKTFWSQSSSEHSSSKSILLYFLAEEFQENIEEDADGESDIQFLDCDWANTASNYLFLVQLRASFCSIRILDNRIRFAINQAKFLLYQNFRI